MRPVGGGRFSNCWRFGAGSRRLEKEWELVVWLKFMAVAILLCVRSAKAMRSEPVVFASAMHAPGLTMPHV